MGTHECAVDGRPIIGPELQVDGTADINTDCGGTGRAAIGHEKGTVDEIVRWKLDGGVGFTGLRWALS